MGLIVNDAEVLRVQSGANNFHQAIQRQSVLELRVGNIFSDAANEKRSDL